MKTKFRPNPICQICGSIEHWELEGPSNHAFIPSNQDIDGIDEMIESLNELLKVERIIVSPHPNTYEPKNYLIFQTRKRMADKTITPWDGSNKFLSINGVKEAFISRNQFQIEKSKLFTWEELLPEILYVYSQYE